MLLVQGVCKHLAHPKPYPVMLRMPKLAAQPGTLLSATSSTSPRWDPSYIILVDSGAPFPCQGHHLLQEKLYHSSGTSYKSGTS